MIALLSILIGLYIVCNAIYLASKSNEEKRYCVLAKYAGALMSGLYLIFQSHDEVSMLFGCTIALFMWPETYYRIYQCVKLHYPEYRNSFPDSIISFLLKLTPQSRRREDYEAHH